jgi:hypothetical protein
MRSGQAALAAGDYGPLGSGVRTSYAQWHIAAVMHLDSAAADQVLIDLLPEPEYLRDVAEMMARDFVPKWEHSWGGVFRFELIRAAREGHLQPPKDTQRRTRFAAALKAEIRHLREQGQSGNASGLYELAEALAAIDGRGSETTVLDVIAVSGPGDQATCLEVAERLMVAGVILPASTVFALADSILEHRKKCNQQSDRRLLLRILVLCPFVDDPAAGVAKLRELLSSRQVWGYELPEVARALVVSGSSAAVDLLLELASDTDLLQLCDRDFIKAFALFDTPRARDFLMRFVDPALSAIAPAYFSRHEDSIAEGLAELARRSPKAEARMKELCECDLPGHSREILAKVMHFLRTPEALAASLNLIDDAKAPPVPLAFRNQVKAAFVERRPYGQSPGTFTSHGRASNELRIWLFRMAKEDEKRRKSALRLLCQIEEWRLRYGRPTGEPRHPDLASGGEWPPVEFYARPHQ